MSSNKKLADFPDVEAKLQRPSKQSAFEKQKADAEAKRRREAAETAAVYESFVKSFDNDEDGDDASQYGRPQGAAFARPARNAPSLGGGGPGKRHFVTGPGGMGLKSGPGSLGPAPGAYGKKKLDSFPPAFNKRGQEDSRARLGFEDEGEGAVATKARGVSGAFVTSDDEGDAGSRDTAEEKAISRPTLRLASLPPGTSPAVIKALIPATLTVENVKVHSHVNTGGSERKSMTAIVTLSAETPAADIDAAVSSLQNQYLGYGHYLSLHRHLSSAVSTTTTSALAISSTSQAFGAKPVPQANDQNSHHPGGFRRGFAPPTYYGPQGSGSISRTIYHVPVQAPRDIKQIQLIHKVVESVLEHGPEFEALLMTRPDVQREEKWSWLWDARSEGGVWYRWRLWEVITGAQAIKSRRGKYLPLFEGSHAWKVPEKSLPFEYATEIDEFISDPDYNSSDDEDFEDEGNKPGDGGENEKTYLNPLDKARLTHLLARLPSTLTKIRKGDIARLTSFAILHSSRGADEIVDMIVANIINPFALTSANPDHKRGGDGEEHGRGSQDTTPVPEDTSGKANESQDTSAASLVGLYVVSDILSSSATSGVRHAWRYRQLFEHCLKQTNVFETLGLMAERLSWGRLRAEKWKRSVGLVLNLWEGWCAFPNETQQWFAQTFENPPSGAAKKEEQSEETTRKAGKWKKTVEAGASAAGVQGERPAGFLPVSAITSAAGHETTAAEDGDPMVYDVDGEAMDGGDEDVDMMDVELDSDIDGVPMDDEDDEGGLQSRGESDRVSAAGHARIEGEAEEPAYPPPPTKSPEQQLSPAPGDSRQQPRRRMRAVDMFADSDQSDEGK
ncbi:hypothetical protein GGR56DRAFT_399952 [Xylariaceae sp. FL0804]|nr:hypothetical protein GGR56DRAFT_399952 [Xylariaceae sp. FL0804]